MSLGQLKATNEQMAVTHLFMDSVDKLDRYQFWECLCTENKGFLIGLFSCEDERLATLYQNEEITIDDIGKQLEELILILRNHWEGTYIPHYGIATNVIVKDDSRVYAKVLPNIQTKIHVIADFEVKVTPIPLVKEIEDNLIVWKVDYIRLNKQVF